MEKEENVLKKLALDAKYRMKHCSYKNKQENATIMRSIAFQNHLRSIKESQCRTPEITIKIIDDCVENEKFEKKVFELLKRDEDCQNPLKELSDNKLLSLMTETEKQKYIFELSEKYNMARTKYYKSKQAYI